MLRSLNRQNFFIGEDRILVIAVIPAGSVILESRVSFLSQIKSSRTRRIRDISIVT